mgnify:FL=1
MYKRLIIYYNNFITRYYTPISHKKLIIIEIKKNHINRGEDYNSPPVYIISP